MFTIKYRFYVLATAQPTDTDTTFYDQCEGCHGPFEVVSQERVDGYIVVHGIDPDGQPMTFGPHKADEDRTSGQAPPRPTVWVMNDHGATVAKYDL